MADETTITHVGGSGGVTTADGWGFFIGAGFEDRPKVGDRIQTIGEFGQRIRGVILNGETLWYMTDEELEAEREAFKAEFARQEAEQEKYSREEYAARLARDPLAFDWDKSGPSTEAAAALDRVTDEAEFPNTYSGQSWRYAYRLWQATAADPDILDGLDAFDEVPGVDSSGLGLSGFMEGWARNAVRQMRGKLPKANPAILTIGGGDIEQDPYPSRGSADEQMRAAIGAKDGAGKRKGRGVRR